MVKNLPAMQETCVRSLGGEDPLEKGMATHSSILAWEIPLTEEPGELYSPWGHEEPDMTQQPSLIHTLTFIRIGGNFQKHFFMIYSSAKFFMIISKIPHKIVTSP